MTIRLLKIIAQAVLVDDDGSSMTELPTETVVLTAADLQGYPERVWADIAKLNGIDPLEEAAASDAPVPPGELVPPDAATRQDRESALNDLIAPRADDNGLREPEFYGGVANSVRFIFDNPEAVLAAIGAVFQTRTSDGWSFWAVPSAVVTETARTD